MKITVKNLQKKIPINPKRIKNAVLETLSSQEINPVRDKTLKVPDGYLRQPVSNGVKKSGEITVCFVNDEKIRKLNLRYLDKSSSTDVLAFDMSTPQEANSIFADIVVSVDMAIHNASLFKTTPLYELCLYVIHGALHLLGYEDRTIKGRKLMQLKAETILAKLKINRKD